MLIKAITYGQFEWIMLIVILILSVIILGMVLTIWRHEWKQPGNDFYKRHGINKKNPD